MLTFFAFICICLFINLLISIFSQRFILRFLEICFNKVTLFKFWESIYKSVYKIYNHIGPVSYTHLDVYKRQPHVKTPPRSFINNKIREPSLTKRLIKHNFPNVDS